MTNIRLGLELIGKLRYYVARTKDEFEEESFYWLVKKISDDLKIKNAKDLVEIFDNAVREMSAMIELKPIRLDDSLTILSSIAKTTSSELSSYYGRIR